MIPLETPRLVIRNWQDRDRDLFHEINSDETVMAFFPFRRSRAQADAFLDQVRREIARDGFGFSALELKATGETIGFAGLHRIDTIPTVAPGTIEIGWRLATRYWGKGYATEAGHEWLRFGFDDLGLDRIVSFAVHNNRRSTAVMERLGMRPDPRRNFDDASLPDTLAGLKRFVFYSLERADWQRTGNCDGAGRQQNPSL